jgi:hypothetical protein
MVLLIMQRAELADLGAEHLELEHRLVVLAHLDKAIMVAATVVVELQAAAAAALVL